MSPVIVDPVLQEAHLRQINGLYYLDLTYIQKRDHYDEKITIPKIRLPIEYFTDLRRQIPSTDNVPDACFIAQFGDVELACLDASLFGKGNGAVFVERINERPQEMTIEEIEEKLGYKVKIVSKGGTMIC